MTWWQFHAKLFSPPWWRRLNGQQHRVALLWTSLHHDQLAGVIQCELMCELMRTIFFLHSPLIPSLLFTTMPWGGRGQILFQGTYDAFQFWYLHKGKLRDSLWNKSKPHYPTGVQLHALRTFCFFMFFPASVKLCFIIGWCIPLTPWATNSQQRRGWPSLARPINLQVYSNLLGLGTYIQKLCSSLFKRRLQLSKDMFVTTTLATRMSMVSSLVLSLSLSTPFPTGSWIDDVSNTKAIKPGLF